MCGRVAALIQEAQGVVHSRRVLCVLSDRPEQHHPGRHLQLQLVQHVRLEQLGSTHAHVLRMHRRLLVLR